MLGLKKKTKKHLSNNCCMRGHMIHTQHNIQACNNKFTPDTHKHTKTSLWQEISEKSKDHLSFSHNCLGSLWKSMTFRKNTTLPPLGLFSFFLFFASSLFLPGLFLFFSFFQITHNLTMSKLRWQFWSDAGEKKRHSSAFDGCGRKCAASAGIFILFFLAELILICFSFWTGACTHARKSGRPYQVWKFFKFPWQNENSRFDCQQTMHVINCILVTVEKSQKRRDTPEGLLSTMLQRVWSAYRLQRCSALKMSLWTSLFSSLKH